MPPLPVPKAPGAQKTAIPAPVIAPQIAPETDSPQQAQAAAPSDDSKGPAFSSYDGSIGKTEGITININLGGEESLYALHPPQYSLLGGQRVLFYEIYLANRSMEGARKLEVLDGERVLKTVSGDELNGSIRAPSGGINDYAVYMWVPLAKDDRPAGISHRIYFSDGETMEGAEMAVDYAAPIIIAPPLYGENWLAAEAPVNTNHHRKGLFAATAIAPTPVVSQRYAIDWMLYGPNGKLYKTDGMANEDWWNYGAEIHAVADGTIMEAHDGIPSNEVGVEPKPVTLLYVAGNNVVEKLGNGSAYALYAHMIPGSVRVKIGDRVKKGQVLGLLGNTGNSGAPHLHFHLDTSQDALFGEGLPYAFESYRLQGNADWKTLMIGNEPWTGKLAAPVKMNMEMPVDGDVVDLGNGG